MRGHLLASLLVVFSAASCFGGDAPLPAGGQGQACSPALPCQTGLYCIDGLCFDAAATGCLDDSGCPAGYKCLSNGLCQANAECETDFDCCFGAGAACELECKNFQCLGTSCTAGDSKPCFDGCHQGEMRCNLGSWTVCDAPPVTNVEICGDGIDNDCNELVDSISEGCTECTPGQSVACETICGQGTDFCEPDGTWRGCDAPTDCTCEPGQSAQEPCGNCGFREGLCGPDGTWNWSDLCASEGECVAGEELTNPCGACGVQRRTCTTECAWGDWGPCEDEGECTPEAQEQTGCGTCGAQTKTCTAACSWGPWGVCDQSGGCTPGGLDYQPCGLCGQKMAVCDANCAWGPYGSCQGEGACSPGTQDTEPCGFCGSRQRTCSNTCAWGNWSACTDGGECDPGDEDTEVCGPSSDLGICEKGSRYRTCSGSCLWNPWSDCAGAVYGSSEICGNGVDEDCNGSDQTNPDAYETNNSCYACTDLGDDPDTTIFASFDHVGDKVDYYCFNALDDPPPVFCPWCNEHIEISLEDQPIGVDADLHLYKGFAACESGDALAWAVTIGPDDEKIDWTETNSDDADIYIIRVQNWEASSCWDTYSLTVKGLH